MWHSNNKEVHAKHQLSPGEFDVAWVGTIWHVDLTWVGNKPIKGTGWACDSKVARTFVKQNMLSHWRGQSIMIVSARQTGGLLQNAQTWDKITTFEFFDYRPNTLVHKLAGGIK